VFWPQAEINPRWHEPSGGTIFWSAALATFAWPVREQ